MFLIGLGPVSEVGRCVFLPTVDPSSKTRLLYESKVLHSVQEQAQDLRLWTTVFSNGLGPVSEVGRCVFLPTVDPSNKTRLLYESKVLDSVQEQAQNLRLWTTVFLNGLGPVSEVGRCVFLPTVDPSSKTRLQYIKVNS